MWIAISIIIVGAITILASLFAIKHVKSLKVGSKIKDNKWIGIGIAMGMPIGMPLGIAMGNIGLGFLWGLPLGYSIGLSLQQKYGKMITLTKELKKQMVWATIAGTITLIAGVITLLAFLLILG